MFDGASAEGQKLILHAVDAADDGAHDQLKRTLPWKVGATVLVLTAGFSSCFLSRRDVDTTIKEMPQGIIGVAASFNRSKQVHLGMRSGVTQNSTEWEVMSNILHVRIQPSLSSKIYGCKQRGQIIIGHQSAGNWVKLKHEPGWVAISVGKQHFLRHRQVTYLQLINGNCADSNHFPITQGTPCLAAGQALGHHVDRLRSFRGKDQLEGCYIKGSQVWVVASGGNLDDGASDGSATALLPAILANNSSMEQICSSSKYVKFSDGYMDQQKVAARLQLVAQSLSDSKIRRHPGSPSTCILLWSLHARDFVRKGFGATMGMFEPLRAYSTFNDCDWAVSQEFAKDWASWGLGPFWTFTVANNLWQARFNAAPACGDLDVSFWSPPLPVKCENGQGLSSQGKEAFTRSPAYNGPGPPKSVFKGAYDLYLQTFGPRLQAYHTPFPEAYAAIHVRHGDKVHESNKLLEIGSAVAILKKYWPHMKKVFLASDDAQVISGAKNVLGNGYTIKTTADEQRWIGGTPESNFNEHVHDDGAVNAVLDDISGLASASILIGNAVSNFFSTALTLNVNLHANLLRRHPWCWDATREKFCG